MKTEVIILDYAFFGAIAQMRYTEPVATLDADVLVELNDLEKLDVSNDIYKYCADKRHHIEGESIQVGEWPIQFIPVFSPLTRESVEQADVADFDGVPPKVVRPEYLPVIALSVARVKDCTRILELLESGSVGVEEISQLALHHGLFKEWKILRIGS